jgi:Peptidase family M28
MSAAQTAAQLTDFPRRGAGTNSERLAALWLSQETESRYREATLETFWCRPNWALAHSWHALLAIAGSLVMVSNAKLGGALVLASLISIGADWLTGRSLGRRLTPEHASQNVVSQPLPTSQNVVSQPLPTSQNVVSQPLPTSQNVVSQPLPTSQNVVSQPLPTGQTARPAVRPSAGPAAGRNTSGPAQERVRLIVTANYDAGRAGLVYRRRLRRATSVLRRLAGDGRLTPGWLGWLVTAVLWLLAVAVIRGLSSGTPGAAVGVLQLLPTVVLVLYLALLLELAASDYGPAASDNAAGTAVALALVRALDAAPPRRLSVELVLQGAGDDGMTGLARHLRARRRQLSPGKAIVLGIGPCGGTAPCWWTSDGNLLPLRYHHRLLGLAAALLATEQALTAWPHRGRGVSPALPGRTAGIPAINLGSLDDQGLPAGSHAPGDTAEALDPQALDGLLQFALMLVEAIDSDLVARETDPPTPSAPAPMAAHL